MKRNAIAVTIFPLLISYNTQAQVNVEHIDAGIGGVTLTGTAENEDLSYFTLTRNRGSEAGALWLNGQRNLAHGFQLELDVSLDPPDSQNLPPLESRGADGIAIVFQKQSQTALGSAGQGIGVYQNNVYGGPGITNGFAIELDTYENQNDCAAPHISVQGMYTDPARQSMISGESNQSLIPCVPLPERVVGYHRLKVIYDAGYLAVYLDDILRLQQRFDWPLADANVFVGVTAGNGAVHEAQAHSLYALELRKRLRPSANRANCEVADWSMNEEVSVNDIFSFLTSYFAPGGLLTLGDLFDFLDSYFICQH